MRWPVVRLLARAQRIQPAGFFAVAGVLIGEPAVQVGLLAAAQGEVVGVEPVQERDGAAGQPADLAGLLAGGGLAVVAAAQPPDQVPGQVAVQQLLPPGAGLGIDQRGQERLEPGHFLVAAGQGTDGDERLPQMGKGPALGQAVEGLVGQRNAAGGKAGQHGDGGRVGQPEHRRAGVAGLGELAAQGLQSRRQGAAGGTHQLVQARVDQAAGALAGVRMAGVAADRAAGPGRGRGAAGAQRAGQGAGGDRRDAAAGRAGGRLPLAGRAPGQAGGAGDAARRGLAADRARQQRQRGAAGAQWPVRGPPLDPAAAPAAGAGLQVRRVGDQAVGAQRPALVIAGSGLAAGSAAGALPGARVRDAGPADPHAIQRCVDAHHPVTARAGRAGDPGHAGGVQRFGQPRDRPQRRQMGLPGQQPRVVLQRPGQFLLV